MMVGKRLPDTNKFSDFFLGTGQSGAGWVLIIKTGRQTA